MRWRGTELWRMDDPTAARIERLSERQKQCLRLVHQGFSSKQIAPILKTTPGTIDNYINTALLKMGATSRRDAARLLAEQESGIVQPLHLLPPAIATDGSTDDQNDQIKEKRGFLAKFFDLPPIGGPDNDLTTPRRILAISRVGFFATLFLIAMIVTVQGVIALLT